MLGHRMSTVSGSCACDKCVHPVMERVKSRLDVGNGSGTDLADKLCYLGTTWRAQMVLLMCQLWLPGYGADGIRSGSWPHFW